MKFLPRIKRRLARKLTAVAYRSAILLDKSAWKNRIKQWGLSILSVGKTVFELLCIIVVLISAVLAVAFFIAIFWYIFDWQRPDWIDGWLGTSDLATAIKWEAIKTLGQALLGLGLIVGIYVAYSRALASEEISKAQHNANEQKMFNEATAKLGDESASVRLGGIYALQKLAESNKNYLASIAEILCTHLRETTQQKGYQKKYKDKPSNEIQSLAKVLSVLNSQKEENGNFNFLRLDLSASYLVGADLRNACLQDVNLRKTNLQGASLDKAQMQMAYLVGAQMQRTHCNEAQLQGVSLHEAQMQGARLWRAQLQGATLIRTQMQGAELRETQLQGADLHQAQMQGATLDRTRMQGAKLSGVDLRGAYGSSSVEHLNLPGRIKKRQDKQTDLTTVIFKGGLRQEDARRIREQLTRYRKDGWMTKEEVTKINVILEEHQDKPINEEEPSGIKTGSYDKKESDAIIAEYEKAMAGVKKIDPLPE